MSHTYDSGPVYAGDRYREMARSMRAEAQQQKKPSMREVYEAYARDLERWARYIEDQVRRYG